VVKVGFIGAGTVGTALAISMAKAGYEIVAVSSRSLSSAEKLASKVAKARAVKVGQEVADAADLVFVTTPDDVIERAASEIRWAPGKYVVHCSGVASTDILEHATRAGAFAGTFHPLQSFANVEQAIVNLPGSTIAIEGAEHTLGTLKKLAEDLGGKWVVLRPGDKVLYHAAAVIISNYTVALAKMATDLWKEFGVDTSDAIEAMMPLLRGTVNNISNVGLPGCLTGPIARGDIGTITKHLEALETRAPSILEAYKVLGLQTVPVSLAKGKIDSQTAKDLENLLSNNVPSRVA